MNHGGIKGCEFFYYRPNRSIKYSFEEKSKKKLGLHHYSLIEIDEDGSITAYFTSGFGQGKKVSREVLDSSWDTISLMNINGNNPFLKTPDGHTVISSDILLGTQQLSEQHLTPRGRIAEDVSLESANNRNRKKANDRIEKTANKTKENWITERTDWKKAGLVVCEHIDDMRGPCLAHYRSRKMFDKHHREHKYKTRSA